MTTFLFFSSVILMQKCKHAKVENNWCKVNMNNYQCYFSTKLRIFKSFGQNWPERVLYSLGASPGLGDGDPHGCASCDGDSPDITFSLHTCLGCGFTFVGVGSLLTSSPL